MFLAQITCVCTGGWRLIWDLPTVQLFSGFLIRVTGKRLELRSKTPVHQCFPAVLGGNWKHSSFNQISHWWNFVIEWWKYFTQTWFRQVTPLWRNGTNLIMSFPEAIWKVSVITSLCVDSFVLTGCHGDNLGYRFPVGFLFWLIARPFFTQMWGMFGLSGAGNKRWTGCGA